MLNNLPTINQKIQDFSNKACFFCAVAFMVFIPSSTALMNIFIFLTLVFFLFSGNLTNNLKISWRNPVSKSALFLFFLLLFSWTWTIDSNEEAFDILKKYNELWYIALLIPIFNSDRRRNIGIIAYLISMGIILFGVYLMVFEIILPIEWTLKGKTGHFNINGGFASHILTNILMAFAMFLSAHKSIFSKSFRKIPFIIFFIFSFYYVLFINIGTSGQILAMALLFLLIIQHAGRKSAFIIPIFISLIAIYSFFNENNSIRFAIEKIGVRYHHLVSTDTAGNNTRPRIYINSFKLIYDEPWIGTGVGSYGRALKDKQPEFYAVNTTARKNPHNEFLMISVQLGLAGLILLLNLFYKQAKFTNKIYKTEYKYMAQGLVILIIIGCMGNSMILDSREGHFWAFFSALLFSNLNKKPLEVDH
tara:strand:- start:2875 stop:4131 length:1257 start_codon:yes stop_codon:yes gene_type:complete